MSRARQRVAGALGRVRGAVMRTHLGRFARLAALDAADTVRGRRNRSRPPRRLQIGDGRTDSDKVGALWAGLLIERAHLRPDSAVLDIGCGPGRIAVHLTEHLRHGRYEGFDVSGRAIRWCRRNISPKHANFSFQMAKVANRRYNPRGATPAAAFTFPYADESFDVAFAASVYTHMTPAEVERYLGETARVLVRGGRSVSSFFLLNPEAERYLASSPEELTHSLTDASGRPFRASHADTPEHRIALPEDDVRRMHEAAGLRIESVTYGRWTGRASGHGGRRQDLVIAERV